MNATPLLLAIQSALPADGATSSPGAVSLQTALLIILAGALLLVARSLGKMRARIEDLEQRPDSASGEAPATAALIPAPILSAVAASDPGAPETLPDEIAAIIAAAIHVTFGSRARITAVTPAHGDDRIWSLEGRRQIFHSHNIR